MRFLFLFYRWENRDPERWGNLAPSGWVKPGCEPWQFDSKTVLFNLMVIFYAYFNIFFKSGDGFELYQRTNFIVCYSFSLSWLFRSSKMYRKHQWNVLTFFIVMWSSYKRRPVVNTNLDFGVFTIPEKRVGSGCRCGWTSFMRTPLPAEWEMCLECMVNVNTCGAFTLYRVLAQTVSSSPCDTGIFPFYSWWEYLRKVRGQEAEWKLLTLYSVYTHAPSSGLLLGSHLHVLLHALR